MKNIISTIIGVFLVCLFLFFGLKGCLIVAWESQKDPTAYSVRGVDGREMTIVFLPEHETMIWYVDPNSKHVEGVLTKMRGTYGTHYVGPLWRIDGPHAGGLFGFRLLSTGQEPIHMEIIVLDKYIEGRGESSFLKTGETSYTVILKEKNKINFQNMWLESINLEPTMIGQLRAMFKKTE